jgi:hypothetical protein
MAGAAVFLYRRYLRSCKRFTIHFGALVVVVRPDGVFFCIPLLPIRIHSARVSSSSSLVYIHIYVCVCVCVCVRVRAYRDPFFLCSRSAPSRKPPNNNRNESSIYVVGTTPRILLYSYFRMTTTTTTTNSTDAATVVNYPNNVRLRRFSSFILAPSPCTHTHTHTHPYLRYTAPRTHPYSLIKNPPPIVQ